MAMTDASSPSVVNALLNAAKENDARRVRALLDANASPDASNVINQSALHIASLWGNLDVARLLLEAGADANAANRFGATPLHCAAQRSQAAVAALLLEAGADPSLVAGNGLAAWEMCPEEELRGAFGAPRTELHAAAAQPEPVSALEAALRAPGVSVDALDERGETALHIAARRCHAAACALLLERGAKTSHLSRQGLAPLHVVASLPLDAPAESTGAPTLDQIRATARLLLEGSADPGAPTRVRDAYSDGSWDRRETDGSTSRISDEGESCVHLAVRASAGRPDIVILLADACAPLDSRSGSTLCTPLHVAVEAGHLEVARALLARGADASAGNRDIGLESSLLHGAAQRSDVALARLLLGARADVDKRGKAGLRPLHLAARTGSAEVALLLLEAGAAVGAADARGKLPADYAQANARQAPVLELLLRWGMGGCSVSEQEGGAA